MTNSVDPGREIDSILHDAGERWRSRQIFGRVAVSDAASHRVRGGARAPFSWTLNFVAVAAIGALVVVAVAALPRQLGPAGGDAGAIATADNGTGPTAAPTDAGTKYDREAAQLAVIEAVNADPTNFGGAYIDTEGVLVIQFVGSNLGRAAVEQKVVPGMSLRWEQVDYTRDQLERIAAEIKDLHLNGVFAISSGTNQNAVVVMVGPAGSASEVAQTLTGYGDAVKVVVSSDFPVFGPWSPPPTP